MISDRPWNEKSFMVLDLETTEADPQEALPVAAAFIRFNPDGSWERRANFLINPGVPIPESATAVHGITDEMVRDAMTLEDAAAAFFKLLMQVCRTLNLPLGIFNASYDATVVDLLLRRFGHASPIPRLPILDPYVLAQNLESKKVGRYSLADLCGRYDVPTGESHQAEADAVAAGRLLLKLAEVYPEVRWPAADLQPVQRYLREQQRQRWEAWRREKYPDEERKPKRKGWPVLEIRVDETDL